MACLVVVLAWLAFGLAGLGISSLGGVIPPLAGPLHFTGVAIAFLGYPAMYVARRYYLSSLHGCSKCFGEKYITHQSLDTQRIMTFTCPRCKGSGREPTFRRH